MRSIPAMPTGYGKRRLPSSADDTGREERHDWRWIDGDLNLRGCTALTELPTGLTVDGLLDLNHCTALIALPDGLRVGGALELRGCTSLTSLPKRLHADGNLTLNRCTALTTLPDGLRVRGALFIKGCNALAALPKGLRVSSHLYLREPTTITALPDDIDVGLRIDLESLFIDVIPQSGETCIVVRDCGIPATARTLAVGRRLGDMIDHWVLSWNGIGEKIITSIRDANPGEVEFYLNS